MKKVDLIVDEKIEEKEETKIKAGEFVWTGNTTKIVKRLKPLDSVVLKFCALFLSNGTFDLSNFILYFFVNEFTSEKVKEIKKNSKQFSTSDYLQHLIVIKNYSKLDQEKSV